MLGHLHICGKLLDAFWSHFGDDLVLLLREHGVERAITVFSLSFLRELLELFSVSRFKGCLGEFSQEVQVLLIVLLWRDCFDLLEERVDDFERE